MRPVDAPLARDAEAGEVLTPPGSSPATPDAPDTAEARASRPPRGDAARRGVMLGGAGSLAVVLAAVAPVGVSGLVRGAVAVAGATVFAAGLQRLGRVRFGPSFRIGLWLSIAWVALVVVLAVTASWLPIDGVDEPVTAERNARPALDLDEPLGRDDFGRSMLSRTVYGARVSIAVAVGTAILGLVAGGALGMLAGFYRGRVDRVIGVFVNATLSFPPLVLLLALVAVLRPSIPNLALALAVLGVPTLTRVARAQTLALTEREFVFAARAVGAKNRRIIVREILPNVAFSLLAYVFLTLAIVIVAEGSLSYLGLGIQPPDPSWGGMIASGQRHLRTDPHLVFVPAIAMFLTVLALNRIGESARQAVSGRQSKL